MPSAITLTELMNALRNHPELYFTDEEALEEAMKLIKILGFEGSVLDNFVRSCERQLLEAYQKFNIVSYIRIEIPTRSNRSKTWKLFYWVLNFEYIRYLNKNGQEKKHNDDDGSCYDILPEYVWNQ
ncbi:MAG: hypothetical protein DRN30_03315 [Thermoplasmata archaeon]|nr:hypothetical protein [Euryarchaeota archaeon]RLF65821.1 MAG: hypothetical protein DRN30_03315 [Thermoplasmata archaeon]